MLDMSKLINKNLIENASDLKKIAKKSSEKAVKESKALGLSITYLKEGVLYEEFPDGTVKKIKEIKSIAASKLNLKKGMVFHAKK
jgi:hypothetical protein